MVRYLTTNGNRPRLEREKTVFRGPLQGRSDRWEGFWRLLQVRSGECPDVAFAMGSHHDTENIVLSLGSSMHAQDTSPDSGAEDSGYRQELERSLSLRHLLVYDMVFLVPIAPMAVF